MLCVNLAGIRQFSLELWPFEFREGGELYKTGGMYLKMLRIGSKSVSVVLAALTHVL